MKVNDNVNENYYYDGSIIGETLKARQAYAALRELRDEEITRENEGLMKLKRGLKKGLMGKKTPLAGGALRG
jgi:hypothetical protein